MSNTEREKLDAWVARLGTADLPILSETNRRIAAIANHDGSTAVELANIVLRDPAMTSQVLRVANTVFYNPTHQSINTISRAVVVLGFNAIFSICVSKTLLDSLGSRDRLQQLLRLTARSLHAGVQARALAEALGHKHPEDVFIAALLFRLGDIALWTQAPEQARRIEELVARDGLPGEAAQRAVLGFTTRELTLAISREWGLSPMLERALAPDSHVLPESRIIGLAHRVSETMARDDREGFGSVTDLLAKELERPPREIRDLIRDHRQKAEELVRGYGLSISLLAERTSARTPLNGRDGQPEGDDRQTLQLQILSEISAMMNQRGGIGLLLEMVLEGIYRGVGMDRAALVLLSRDRQQLSTKCALGKGQDPLSSDLQLPLAETPWLRRLLDTGQPAWYQPEERRFAPDQRFLRAVGDAPFFIMPIGTPERMIGLLYADRRVSQRPLAENDFSGFRLFGQQASLGLTYLERQ